MTTSHTDPDLPDELPPWTGDELVDPAEADELLTCGRCGAHYLNDEAGWAAHRAVFGHAPVSGEPERE